jgi:ATP-dependent DNA helicase RecQ
MKERALKLLRAALASATVDFRPGQWEAVQALFERERLLMVQRTGWGKSLVYFLATKLLRDHGAGFTLLISPLLALMRNQIEAAARLGIRAETINSTNQSDWDRIEHALRLDHVDLLLVSPERLGNADFVKGCLLPQAARVGLLVVDEAHCISDWGHDFRPDYQRIVRILQALPANIPVLATTATANDRVVADIDRQLGPHLRIVRGRLSRESLKLQNLRIPSKAARLAWLARYVPKLPGSGIIYTLTIHDAALVAEWLRSRGINAAAYHSQIEKDRPELESRLLRNEVKALVATVALGMGFDKPDLGFVIHFQRPASVVHYYQQVGRAGRSLDSAYGILLSGIEDDEIADYFLRSAFPSEEDVALVLLQLREAGVPLKFSELQHRLNLSAGKLGGALRFLQLQAPAPIQKTGDGFVLNPVPWRMPKEKIQRLSELRRGEQERMRAYMTSGECLMRFLSRELNDEDAPRCGKCANCRGKGLSPEVPAALEAAATEFLDSLSIVIEPRKKWPSGASFEGMQGIIPVELQLQPGRSLCRWGAPGLGDLVQQGKQHAGRFSDRLVAAAAHLIRQRWGPQPVPQWLTSAPSRRNHQLVPDFARRLAPALGIRYVDCVRKVRETQPQKTRQNTFHQAQNLEYAYEIDPNKVFSSPVLLVDDMVDSRWTLAVLGLKLLQAGSGPVFPFALADSSAEDGD